MKNRRVVRVLAILLVILLAGGAVVSAIIGTLALAEAPEALSLSAQRMTIEYLEEEQALRVSQRLDYVNRTGRALEAVVFYAAGNMFRRQAALMYGAKDFGALFPGGYAPAGIDLRDVRFGGMPADYGFQGEEELYLRVSCDLRPGETGAFEFEYYLLLMRCNAFQGAGETDVRVSAFSFVPGVYDALHGEFVLAQPIAHARWLYCEAADYEVTLLLPERWLPAATGGCERGETQDGRTAWTMRAEGVRDFALSFGRRWREREAESGGVRIRAYACVRGAEKRMVDAAQRAIGHCAEWLGAFPLDELELAQSDYPLGPLNFPGLIWIPSALLSPGREAELEKAVRFCVAQQYVGLSAYVEPSADAWLSDSVCEYLSYLMLEAEEGRDAFLRAVNRDWVSALQLTVPGGLNVTSDAMLFSAGEYDLVVRTRGAVVMHELREAMGTDGLLAGIAEFCRMGGPGRTLTEMDFVKALDAATGGDWEMYLTDLVFNIGEYVNQSIDWYE